ncbi:MAG: hypothetical protein COW01_07585 [Bdellovibrionales bacterium CG12_big_fil_rev_8_21_14_0_65_38_15]|nr:MAG: hypothetical protein COW79_01475 [Bdellovibrionales bacterium CG22_combo_CG10-13_8_21_14_all_38_13]PIQ55231.1 MAG: hypothetical protein COW01_07585 [Bdellovibrionales bacterium CG12_big_fil_rev_8_21_14_0_65_38_15]PIR30521.1 MAG: hypothetical protein COV38_05065 [Bdellovibrionales bacterium CG11_big_fil_rev_8_21_14_0_20_38_13]
MKKFLVISITLIISLNLYAQTTISKVTDRKTGDTILVNCIDECSTIEFVLDQNSQLEVLSRLDQYDYSQMIASLTKDDRALVKDNFFLLMQGFTKLPWDDEEFVMVYILGAGITIPLTAIGLGIDVALLPLGVATYAEDLFNGNVGRKLARKIRKGKSMKLGHYRFDYLVGQLRQ